jgi:serine/threonine protein kinase
MAPERIQGQSYTITSDVWSLGVTLLEVAQHRFPFPADGTEMQPRAGLIDLLTYIVRQPIPQLKDEPVHGIKWSESFKYFVECWYVDANLFLLLLLLLPSSFFLPSLNFLSLLLFMFPSGC